MSNDSRDTGGESADLAVNDGRPSDPAAPSRYDLSSSRLLADDQLVVLHEVSKSLAQDRSLQATLALVAEKARFLTSSASTALCLLDEDREVLDFAAVAGRGASEMVGQRVRVDDALPGRTAVTGDPLLAYNPAQPSSNMGKAPGLPSPAGAESAHFDEPFVLSGGVRSAAVVPIVIGALSVGSLAAINRLDGESFTGSDLLMLQILASSASIAIQKDFLTRQAAQRERERNILFRVAQNTSASLDVQKILDGTLETLTYSMDMFASIIFLLNDEGTHLYIASHYGLSEEELEIQLLAEGPLASSALSGGGRAFVIVDPENDPHFEEILPQARAHVRSMMVVPLAARESPSGVIVVMSRQLGAYNKEDLALLAAVSAQTAVAMENAWLYEDATRRAEEATAIYELSQAVNTKLNLTRVLNFVADSILALMQVDKFALFLHNPKKNCLEIKVARNIRRETVQSMCPNPEQRGIAWWVYEYETPTAVQDVAADHRNRSCPIDQEGVASLVSVPLQAGDEVTGVIHAMSSRRRSFTVAEMELLYTIANQVGVAISNIQILEETKQKSADLRRSFRRVARALGASADTSQTAQTIVELAAEMMDIERVVLYATVEGRTGGQELSLRAAHGLRLPAAAFGSTIAPLDGVKETSAGWVARRGRSLAIAEPASDPRFAPPALLAPYVTRSGFYLAAPLKIGRRIVGVLEVYARESRSIPADEMRRHLTLVAQSAVALQNSLLVEEASKRHEDVETIGAIMELLRAAVTVDAGVLEHCLRRLLAATQSEYALIVGVGQKRGVKRKGLLVDRSGEVVEPGTTSADEPSVRDTLLSVIEAIQEKRLAEFAWPSKSGPGAAWPSKSHDPRPVAAFALSGRSAAATLIVARRSGRPPLTPGERRLVQIVANLLSLFV